MSGLIVAPDKSELAQHGGEAEARELAELEEWAKQNISEPGALGLPDLLDERRIEYAMPDEVFKIEAVWDRVYLWQVSESKGDTFIDGGVIAMPETAKERVKQATPQGIIVSAGLPALDYLVSNGLGLGHHVAFVRLSPYRLPIKLPGGREAYVVICRPGDICGSLDLPRLRREDGYTTEVQVDKDGDAYHVMRAGGDRLLRPQVPAIGEEY